MVTIVPLSNEWFERARVRTVAVRHLLASLKSLEKEQDPTPSFPLYGSRNAKELILNFLDSLPWENYHLPEGVKEYEYDRLKKVGPQGGHPSWDEMKPLFYLYQERLAPCKGVSEWTRAYVSDLIRSAFPKYVEPLDVNITLASLIATDKIFNTAAGCRNFNLKKTDLVAQSEAITDYESGLYENFFMYVFERYQKLKPRIFMPGPFSNMIDQARFVLPYMLQLQGNLRKFHNEYSLYHFGDKIGFAELFENIMLPKFLKSLNCLESTVRRVTGRRLVTDELTVLYIQGDFEKMDTTTGPSQYEKLYLPTRELCYRESWRSEFRKSMMKTTTMPIASPSGVMVGAHGTGSGMENTNDGEGNSNLNYGTEVKRIFSLEMKKLFPHIIFKFAGDYYNGDDSSFIILLYNVTSAELAAIETLYQQCAVTVAKRLGFRINDKWRMDTHFGLYNQNVFWFERASDRWQIRWMYPATLILNAIINPEHEYSHDEWDRDYRDIDIVEKLDNGRNLPYFEPLIDYVDNGMKYHLLRRDQKATYRILSKYDKYRALQNLGERYNRQDYDISSSPTIRYLLTKFASS